MRSRWTSAEARTLAAVTGIPDPPEAVEHLARGLLDDVGLKSPPFDPRILASFIGATVAEVQMRGAARLVPTREGLAIEVNGNHSRGKKHFSIDHEITHTLLPTYANQRVDDAETGAFPYNAEEELLCDIGAATLLLDSRQIGPIVATASPGIAILEEIAQRFQASLEATARRLAGLDLWPCAFVFWEDGFRAGRKPQEGPSLFPELDALGPPQPQLRVSRAYRSPSFRYYIAPNKSVSEGSVVARCAIVGPCAAVEHFDLGPTAVELYADCASVQMRDREGRRVLSVLVDASPPSSSPEFDAATLPMLDA